MSCVSVQWMIHGHAHHNIITSLYYTVASAPTNMMAVQEGLTHIRVSWSPPTPLGDTNGYRIYYSESGSVNVSGGSTSNYLLTGLENGATYTISIVATSKHFFSLNVKTVTIVLGEFLECMVHIEYIYTVMLINPAYSHIIFYKSFFV